MPLNLTIYVDVLFLLNLTIDYIILCSTALITGKYIIKARVLSASLLGALYSVIIFFPQFEVFKLVIMKLILSVFMIVISFRYTGVLSLFKVLTVYYIINAVYGGGMYAFHHFTSLGTKMNFSNGVYYIDLPLIYVIILAFVFYFLIKFFSYISEGSIQSHRTVDIRIGFLEQEIIVKALIDTGNSLCDPISLMPVMLVESRALESILSKYFLDKATQRYSDLLPELHRIYPDLKLRVIPFQDICGDKNILFAFKPKFIKIADTGKDIPNTLVAIIPSELSIEGNYNALIHSKI